jgi:hypothetical protein
MEWLFKGVVAESVAAPSPAANWTYTQAPLRNGIAARRLVSVLGTMTTAGVAANRELRIEVDDGTNLMSAAHFGSAIIASTVRPYNFLRGQGVYLSGSTASTIGVNPMGDLWVLPAWRVLGILQSIQAGDQFSITRLIFEEWGQ